MRASSSRSTSRIASRSSRPRCSWVHDAHVTSGSTASSRWASTSRKGVPFAYALESDVPIVVQHSRLDTTAGGYTLFTTIGYSE